MKRTATVKGSVLVTLLVLASASTFAEPEREPVPPTPTHPCAAGKSARLQRLPAAAGPGDARLDYDVLHYDLAFEPDFQAERLSGETSARVRALAVGIDRLVFDLGDNMVVDSTWLDSAGVRVPLDFLHADGKLTLVLQRALAEDETLRVGMDYSGEPGGSPSFGHRFFGEHGGAKIAASMSEPSSAHTWWACKELWDDKATVSVSITADSGMVAVSNGNLADQIPAAGGGVVSIWKCRYPVASYLVAIAVSNYVSWSETYSQGDSAEIDLVYYAYPEDEKEARESWTAPTREAMTIFEDLFGVYPFRHRYHREKYGTVEFHTGGLAEEHQTISSFGYRMIDAEHSKDWVVAHELAHHWFGNAVTPYDVKDTWTKEGVATYCEALYMERRELLRGGSQEDAREALLAHMGTVRPPFRFERFPTADPDDPYHPSSVYHKGAWIMHMLRRIMGDDDFFAFMKDFVFNDLRLYGNAGTEELVDTAERFYGDLSWFFEPYLYEVARPFVSYDWSTRPSGDAWEVHLHLEQTQVAEAFRLPLDILALRGTEEHLETTWMEGRWQDIVFETPFQPEELVLDPDEWLLVGDTPDRFTRMTDAGPGLALRPTAPNPLSGGIGTAIRFRIPEEGIASLDLIDVLGRHRATLMSGARPRGWQVFEWDGLVDGGRLASGVYYLRLRQGGREASQRVLILH